MTTEEFSILVKGMREVYPGEKFIATENAFRIWYELLKDLPYEVANAAIQRHMITNKFAPTIAEIREQAAEVANEPYKDAGQAWQDVMLAVRRYGFYAQQEALESLDPITRQAAERFGFRDLCDTPTDDNTIARAQFMKIYNGLVAREKEDAKIPEHVRARLAMLRANAGMIEDKGAEAYAAVDNL